MPLAPGTRLGPYEVVAAIGAGGMGEVYRARDTQLNRQVAIKVLPEAFSQDAERLARFTREAQTLAALNHPNIAAIYGIEQNALVMELVEGRDLSEMIHSSEAGPSGPASMPGLKTRPPSGIPLSDVLPIARQIAEALEVAHEAGIVHRDLKPANIKVRADGTVKVLDFGLAKAMQPAGASTSADAMNSPTITSPVMTEQGMILGTAAYMAPEQARGKSVDKRADVWAFGVIVYEMLTGTRLFSGAEVTDVLAAVLRQDIDWTVLPAQTPMRLRRLLERCLDRDPKSRLRDIGEARVEIAKIHSGAPDASTITGARSSLPAPLWRRVMPTVIVVAAVVAASALTWTLKPIPPVNSVVSRFRYVLPESQLFTRIGRHVVAISPDGSKIVYVANRQLYLRGIDQLEAQPIGGTDEDPIDPVFSPDGQSIAYFTPGTDDFGSTTTLKKIAISGGAPVTLCVTNTFPYGASWRNGLIAFGQGSSIEVVADSGGKPRTLVAGDSAHLAVQPQLLDDDTHVLFTLVPLNATTDDEGQIVVQQLDGSARAVLMTGGTNAQILSTGHLVYIHNGTLFARPIDSRRMAVTGGSVAIVEGVAESNASWQGQFAVSRSGTLVYRPGVFSGGVLVLVWVDRQGREQPVAAKPQGYVYARLSPDSTTIVVSSYDGESDLWTWDVAKETLTRLTFGPAKELYAAWMPNSRHLLVNSSGAGHADLSRRLADGTGGVEPLTTNGGGGEPQSISPDGKLLVYRTGGTNSDLRLLPLDGTGQSRALLSDPKYNELNGEVSPNGRWIAYQSTESGPSEVFVRPFPNVDDGKWQVSSGGGSQPLWSRSGRELFFVSGSRLLGVSVQPGAGFAFGKPQIVLGNLTNYVLWTGRSYDIAADGRFLMTKNLGTTVENALVVVSHWFDDLKARMSSK